MEDSLPSSFRFSANPGPCNCNSGSSFLFWLSNGNAIHFQKVTHIPTHKAPSILETAMDHQVLLTLGSSFTLLLPVGDYFLLLYVSYDYFRPIWIISF